MKGALIGKRAGALWLFTDGRDAQVPRVDTVVQQLNRQQVKGSIALLGGCATPPLDPNRLNGTETYLGNAAGPQSSGIVPYLVTAMRSGGQFLFVNPDQIGLASDILRAQLANSAGAGRWSDYVTLQVAVFDEQGVFVADGTLVQMQTTLGTVDPAVGATQGGLVKAVFTAGTQEGDAVITATVDQASDSTTMYLRNPLPDTIALVATPTDLSGRSTSATLVATVRDRWGNLLANQSVRLGASGDAQLGTLTGESEVITMTTDANGQVTTLFTKGTEAAGIVDIRAELLVTSGGNQQVAHIAQVGLNLGGVNPTSPNRLYLPFMTKTGAATAQPDLVIFADAPATGWQDWSWNSTIDPASTLLAHDGSQAIAIMHNAAQAGFSLRSPTAIDATQYSAIRFWICGSGNGNPLLHYLLILGNSRQHRPFVVKSGTEQILFSPF